MSGQKTSPSQDAPDGSAAPPLTVGAALRTATRAGIDRLDAQLMLADLLGRGRTWLLANEDSTLDASRSTAWASLLERRRGGEPLAYLLQEKEFFGLSLQVTAAVLIPRADTETLVEWALELLRSGETGKLPPQVIDLGCGSGAIALALKSAHPAAQLTAVDSSQAALAVAQANARRLALSVNWCSSDWWTAVGDLRFDLAVANPPYIAEDDPHLQALHHEPKQALVAANNGLAALQQIVTDAPQHLRAGAWLLLEHGYQQAAEVSAALRERGFELVQTRADLAGHPRCTGGRWPADIQRSDGISTKLPPTGVI